MRTNPNLLTPSYLRREDGTWGGTLKAFGRVVWTCDHHHINRDHSSMLRGTCAMDCARAELLARSKVNPVIGQWEPVFYEGVLGCHFYLVRKTNLGLGIHSPAELLCDSRPPQCLFVFSTEDEAQYAAARFNAASARDLPALNAEYRLRKESACA